MTPCSSARACWRPRSASERFRRGERRVRSALVLCTAVRVPGGVRCLCSDEHQAERLEPPTHGVQRRTVAVRDGLGVLRERRDERALAHRRERSEARRGSGDITDAQEVVEETAPPQPADRQPRREWPPSRAPPWLPIGLPAATAVQARPTSSSASENADRGVASISAMSGRRAVEIAEPRLRYGEQRELHPMRTVEARCPSTSVPPPPTTSRPYAAVRRGAQHVRDPAGTTFARAAVHCAASVRTRAPRAPAPRRCVLPRAAPGPCTRCGSQDAP